MSDGKGRQVRVPIRIYMELDRRRKPGQALWGVIQEAIEASDLLKRKDDEETGQGKIPASDRALVGIV